MSKIYMSHRYIEHFKGKPFCVFFIYLNGIYGILICHASCSFTVV